MMGTMRFFLSCLVAFSHVGWRIQGLNPGVVAVVGFYMVSGMAMVQIWSHYYHATFTTRSRMQAVGAFYGDRILRLWPSYLVIMGVTAAAWRMHWIQSPFLPASGDWAIWLENGLILPLNFFAWNGSDHHVFIPPAWSLGAEVQFYLLVPLLFGLPRRTWIAAVLCSATVFLCAATGMIPSELWGYRLLPGVLFIFLMGSCLWLWQNAEARAGVTLMAVALPLGAMVGLVSFAHAWTLPYNLEILLGIMLATLLILVLPRRGGPADRLLGELAYPMFLSHFLAWWLLGAPEAGAGLIGFSLLTLGLALALVVLVERPCAGWRHHFRQYALR